MSRSAAAVCLLATFAVARMCAAWPAPSVDSDCDSDAAADMRAARRSLFSPTPSRRSGASKEANAPEAAGMPAVVGDGYRIWFIGDPLFVL
jgi:hypothetical protein